jgi:purine-nucleoside phosphorylase
MASLPVVVDKVPPRVQIIRNLLAKGWTEEDIVERLAAGDDRKAKSVRTQLRNLVYNDAATQQIQGSIGKGTLMLHMPTMVDALVRRASKGNIPAIKLAMEASGFYNPRMEHHHSGKIEVELKGVPRPAPTTDEDHSNEATIYEADVVEE